MSPRSAGKRAPASRSSVPLPAAAPRGLRWRAALVVLAGLLTYWNSLQGVFILDDQGTIVDNQQIREWWRLSTVLFPEPGSSASGRPLVNLSLAINYALGGLDVRGYHVWNVAVHLGCALLLFGIVRRTLELPRVRARLAVGAANAALAISLLWTVHPLNSEVVDYLTQRSESMVAFFYLLTLYAGIRAAAAARPAAWRAAAVLACALGMACKESMATAPLVVALYDRGYLFDSWRHAWRNRRPLYLGLAATWLMLLVLNASGPRSEVVGFSTGVSAWTYLLNQAVMIVTYLRLSVWPRPLVVFYGWPLPLTLADVWWQVLCLTLVAGAVLVGLVRGSMLAFVGAWFFVTLGPSSSIVPIATEVGAERRMYLPLIALVTLVVISTSVLWDRARKRWPSLADGFASRAALGGAAAATLVLAGSLAAATIARNREYASALTMARTVVERRPTGVAHHILAEQLSVANRHDEAVMHLREAVALGDSRAGHSLGVELFNQGKLNDAVEQFDAFVRTSGLPYRLVPHWLEPLPADVMSARTGMARAFAMQGRWPQAAEQAQRILAIAPSHVEGLGLLADALFGQQRFEEAGQRYRDYLKVRGGDTRALTNFGVTLVAGDRLEDAIGAFRRVVDLEPANAAGHRLLGMALLDHGEVEEAVRQARQAMALQPAHPGNRELLAHAEAAARGGGAPRRPGP